MIKRLRRHIILVNMILVGIVIMLIFSVVCVNSYSTANGELERGLNQVIEKNTKSMKNFMDFPKLDETDDVDEDDVDDLFVEMALNGINDHRCYPFVSEEGFGRVLDLYLKGEIDFDFDDAYPFMDDDDIRRLFRNEIRKRKEQ